MKPPIFRAALITATITLALVATPSQAIAPLIALLGKQLLQDMVMTTAKSMLMNSLRGTGCKGTALANALDSFGSLQGGGLGALRGLPGAAGVGGMPAMPVMPAMHGIPTVPGMAGMTGMTGLTGMGGMGGMPPDMAAQMTGMLTGMMPGGGLDAEQSASFAGLQQLMRAPLSPLETIATIDEMSELGLLSAAMSTELKECLLLLPQSAAGMGMTMGMMKPMLPKFREARDEMRALSPVEQDELAASLAEEFDKVPAADRKRMLTELGGGLFPPRVVETLSRRYGAQ